MTAKNSTNLPHLLSILIGGFVLAMAAASPLTAFAGTYTDNFDSYSTGDLVGQGSWLDGGGSGSAQVTTAQFSSSPNSIRSSGNKDVRIDMGGVGQSSFYYSYDFYWDGFVTGMGNEQFNPITAEGLQNFRWTTSSGGKWQMPDASTDLLMQIPANTWVTLECFVSFNNDVFWDVDCYMDGDLIVTGSFALSSNTTVRYLSAPYGGNVPSVQHNHFWVDNLFVAWSTDIPSPPGADPCLDGDLGTCISTVEPEDGEIVSTTTPTTWGMTGYISADDFREGARARLKLDRNTDQQAVGSLIALESATGNYTNFEIGVAGAISISTSTVEHLLGVEREGVWRMRWEIQSPRLNIFGFSLFYDTLEFNSSTYTYGEATAVDVIQEQQRALLETLFEASTDPLSGCQFDFSTVLDFSAEDNIFTCVLTMVSSMVIPNGQQAEILIQGARESFLEKAPWGYATRVYDILSYSTATSTLPSIAFTLPDGLPNAEKEQVIDFSPWAPIESAVERIDTAEVETIDGSPLAQFLFWWNTMWLLMFALWLIRELHGAWEAGDFEHDGHSSSSMDKGIYAYRGLVQTRNKMDRHALREEQRRIIRSSRRK